MKTQTETAVTIMSAKW